MDLFTGSPSRMTVTNLTGVGGGGSNSGNGVFGGVTNFMSGFKMSGVLIFILVIAFVGATGYLIYSGLNRVFSELGNQRNIIINELGLASRIHKDVSEQTDTIKQLQERQGTLLNMLVESLQAPFVEGEEDGHDQDQDEEEYEGEAEAEAELDGDGDGEGDEQVEEYYEEEGRDEEANVDGDESEQLHVEVEEGQDGWSDE